MKAFFECGGSKTLTLKGLLLFYEGRNGAYTVWHEVETGFGEAARLGEAQAPTTDFVKSLGEGLRASHRPELLPVNTLVWSFDLLVWWSPRATRRLFFRHNSEAPANLNGDKFSQPPLLWCLAGQVLTVRALPVSRRPDANTPLMIAPYWNVDGDTGRVCLGSMRTPEIAGAAALAQWETAFFESEFTHQTGVKRLVRSQREYFDMWDQVRGGNRAFPAKYLVPANETLADLIRRCS